MLLAFACLATATGIGAQPAVAWKHIAGTTIQENLAGPATGPVRNVWYSPAGNRLLATTAANRVFESADFQHWRLNTTDTAPALFFFTNVTHPPEPGARVQAAGPRLYATGANNIYASDDNGRTWLNLTGYNNRSIVGGGFTSLAISPANPDELAVANQFGVWRSLDGGLSWRSLNDDLPNLPVRKLTGRRSVSLVDGTILEFESGIWTPAAAPDPETALRRQLSSTSGFNLTAAATAGAITYAGTSEGALMVSRNNGAAWQEAPRLASQPANQPIARIWADADRPESALAAVGTRLLRTVNGGLFWSDVTGSLPVAQIHGIAADRAASVVYLATDRGVYQGTLSLNDAGPAVSNWKSISPGLPAAAAWDVRLNLDNTLTVALDGYGVYETSAPHQPRNVRVVNGADLSDRAAAPGSLISVLGANVKEGSNGTADFPVIVSSDASSQLQVPFEAATGPSRIALKGANDQWSLPLTVKETSPVIFVNEDGAPLVLDSASGFVIDANTAIHAGTSIQVMATGLGKVAPDWPTGIPAPLDSPPVVRGIVTAFLDGAPVQVSRATLAPGYVGYYLVELQIPSIVNKGASELRIVMNGEESNRVKLYLDTEPAQ